MKRIYIVCIFASLMVLSLIACQKEVTNPEEPKKHEVELFLESLFESHYTILQEHPPSNLKNTADFFVIPASYRSLLQEATEQKMVYQQNGYAISNVLTDVNAEELREENGSASVMINLQTSFHTGTTSQETGESIQTVITEQFKCQLTRTKTGYKIIQLDEVFRDRTSDDPEIEESSAGIDRALRSEKKKGKYDGATAAKYARKYAFKNVPCSDYYSDRGGDCTNFVSRCLKEGGWKNDDIWNYTYCGKGGASYAWGGADNLKQYLMTSDRVHSYSPAISSLELGDIISVDFTNNKKFDHNTMVTEKDRKGKIFLSYHTSNTLNILYDDFIRKLKKNSPDYRVRPFHLKSSY